MVNNRKIPLRKCTGCLEMKSKNTLVRVVHGVDGNFSLDTTGKMQGRGAYVCAKLECLEKSYKQKGLERSFKTFVPSDIYEALKKELADKNG